MIESESFFAYSDSFCFYVESTVENPLQNNAVISKLRKTARKNKCAADLVGRLNGFIDQFEETQSTFTESLNKSIANNNIKRLAYIKSGNGKLIEIRIKPTLWRVLAYLDEATETIVMIDAMEAHLHRTIAELAESSKSKIKKIKEIIEREGRNGR